MEDRTPYALRPLYNEYLTIGHILRHEISYLNMTRPVFVSCCMFYSNGFMDPKRASVIYDNLMIDAGLPPLESE